MTFVYDVLFRGFLMFVALVASFSLIGLGYFFSTFQTAFQINGVNFDMRFFYAYFSMVVILFLLSKLTHHGGFLDHLCFCGIVSFNIGLMAVTIAADQFLRYSKSFYETSPTIAPSFFQYATFKDLENEFPLATIMGLLITSNVLTLMATLSYREHDARKLTL